MVRSTKKDYLCLVVFICCASVATVQAGWIPQSWVNAYEDHKEKFWIGGSALGLAGAAWWAHKRPEEAKRLKQKAQGFVNTVKNKLLSPMGKGIPLAASVAAGFFHIAKSCEVLSCIYHGWNIQTMWDLLPTYVGVEPCYDPETDDDRKLKNSLNTLVDVACNKGLRARLGIKGYLLHGPAGSGKTRFLRDLKAQAGEHLAVFVINSSKIRNAVDLDLTLTNIKNVGRTVPFISTCNRWMGRGSVIPEHVNIVVFFDEIDGIAGARNARMPGSEHAKMVNTLLTHIDGVMKDNTHILYIGATNHLDAVDRSLRDRLRAVEIPLPSQHALKFAMTERITTYTAGRVTHDGRYIAPLLDNDFKRPLEDFVGNNSFEGWSYRTAERFVNDLVLHCKGKQLADVDIQAICKQCKDALTRELHNNADDGPASSTQ